MLTILDRYGKIVGLGIKNNNLMFALFDAKGYPLPITESVVRSLYPVSGNIYVSSNGELVIDAAGRVDFHHTGRVFSIGDVKIDCYYDGRIFSVGETKMDGYWTSYGSCNASFDYHNGKIYSVNGIRFEYCNDNKRLYSLGGVRIDYHHTGRLYSVGDKRVDYLYDGRLFEV